MKLLLATNNQNKLQEFQALLAGTRWQPVLPEKNLNVAETGKTFKANAILKAQAYARYFNQPVLADDSGLCIDYLNGAPGIESHRFAANGFAAARQEILKLLAKVAWPKRRATFRCVLAYADPQKNLLITFSGSIKGYISQKESGKNGFGYDPIFYCPQLKTTFANVSLLVKNQHCHRGRAVVKLLKYLNQC